MLKPTATVVVAIVLVTVSLATGFFAARVFVTGAENDRLAEHHRVASQQAFQAGDIAEGERRGTWANEFQETAYERREIATLLAVLSALVGVPGLVLSVSLYRSSVRTSAGVAIGAGALTSEAVYSSSDARVSRSGEFSSSEPRRRTDERQHKPNLSQRGPASDAFVSYAREDKDFARDLVGRLRERGREVWIDWQDIPLTADWMEEIYRAIDGTSTVIFIISPTSVASTICRSELEHAVSSGKRIIPILRQEVPEQQIPAVAARLNWVFFRPQDDPANAFEELSRALELDLDWARFHARILVRAKEWQENGLDDSFLLTGIDLEDAQRRISSAPDRLPGLNSIQSSYLAASQYGSMVRQRRQIRGFYVASVVYGLIQPALTYVVAFDEISESGLIQLAPVWTLALAFGGSGLLMTRPTLGKSAVFACTAAIIMLILYYTVWPSL